LIWFLRKELFRKRTKQELIDFLKKLGKAYLKENLRLYKSLFLKFDPEYQKQKKDFNHQQQFKKDLQRCLKMLQYVDVKMVKMGKSRTERRQFWRDFFKNAQVRTEVFDDLDKEIR
jgi:catalase (peroxidase I)